MDIYVYNHDRQPNGVVESYEYFKWTRRYSKAGSFVLKAVGTSENAALLRIGGYIKKNDDQEIAMIEHIEFSQTDKEMITASGRFATAMLDRRIIWGIETLYGDLCDYVGQLINNHLIVFGHSVNWRMRYLKTKRCRLTTTTWLVYHTSDR